MCLNVTVIGHPGTCLNPFMPTVPYSGHSGFIIMFQLCVIFAFCRHEPIKSDFLYPIPVKKFSGISRWRLPFAGSGKLFIAWYFSVENETGY